MKTIGLYPNADKDEGFAGTARVAAFLGKRARLLADEAQKTALKTALGREADALSYVPADRLVREADAMVVLGGDGSILRCARRCAPEGVPLVGINLGRVGYMAELELDEIGLLEALCEDGFRIEHRMMLSAEFGEHTSFALNDAVLAGESVFRLVEIELYCDGKLVSRYRADGLIASTPTGSTAYSLSAGGAVLDPRMEAMMLTPICSHSLNATPVVFSADSVLTMKNVSAREEKLYLCLDGSETVTLAYGESVRIRRCPMTADFIRLKDGGFYEVMHRKMAEIT